MKVILSFCANCSVLLPSGLGLGYDPKCQNCDETVLSVEKRIEGEFSETEAARLQKLNFG